MVRPLRHILFLIFIAFSFSCIISCGSDGCEDNKSSLPLAGFYSSQTKSAISIDSLTVYAIGMPGDTTIIDTATVAQVQMPFNLSDTITRFVFRYEQKDIAAFGVTDTVTIAYKSTPFFHSSECGAFYIYDISEYSTSHNLIDSVRIPQTRIDNANRENIRIFFRTQEADEQ